MAFVHEAKDDQETSIDARVRFVDGSGSIDRRSNANDHGTPAEVPWSLVRWRRVQPTQAQINRRPTDQNFALIPA
jgi:hypothetical protein